MHPEIMFQFSPSNQVFDFKDDSIDLAIRRGGGVYPGLESRLLIKDEVLFVASPLLFKDAFPSMDELLKAPLLLDISSDLKPAFEQFCDQYKLNSNDFEISLQTTDSVPVIEKAIAGQGICFVSKSLVFDRVNDGTLINLFQFSVEGPMALYLVAPPRNFHWAKVQKFETWLTTLFNKA